MDATYKTPWARWARICEIFIPGYMFGKAWGIANETTVELYRVTFPSFLVDMAEYVKGLITVDSPALGLLVATSAGAVVGFAVIFLLGLVMHLVLGDRRYSDSLRFTSVTLIPLAVMNGTLSHLTNTLFESLGAGESLEALTASAVDGPRGQIIMFCIFYITSLWMMGGRTGVKGFRRWAVLVVGIGFMAAYFACGLGITESEWLEVLPKLQAAVEAHQSR